MLHLSLQSQAAKEKYEVACKRFAERNYLAGQGNYNRSCCHFLRPTSPGQRESEKFILSNLVWISA